MFTLKGSVSQRGAHDTQGGNLINKGATQKWTRLDKYKNLQN